MLSVFAIGAVSVFAHVPAAMAAPVLRAAAASTEVAFLETPMNDLEMSNASGGEDTAIDVGVLGVNLSTTNGAVSGVTVAGGTGAIENNLVNGNSGITAVFNNTGNGVIFQNTVQVNIFLNGPQ